MKYNYTVTTVTDEEDNLLEVNYNYEDRFENHAYKVVTEDLDMGAESRIQDVTNPETTRRQQVEEFQGKLRNVLGTDVVEFSEEQKQAADDCVILLEVMIFLESR